MNLKLAGAIAIGISTLVLSACGGGDGGSATGTTSTAAPTVTMSFDQPKLALNQTAKLTWTTTNATSCIASGSWSGTQATSGTSTQTATASGQSVFTLECTGPGGSATQSATMMVPLPVQKTSYLNRMTAVAAIGPQAIPETGNLPGWNTVAYAFGDFFQEGTYSLVTHTQESDNSKPAAQGAVAGHIKFWKMDANGNWVDHTADILPDNSGCVLARKILVADFNGDGLPDVYVSCTGFDASPFSGENQRILLSDRTTHTYKNTVVPVTAYAHGASAADIDGDGKIDVLVADMNGNGKKNPLYVLKGNGDGTFTVDYSMVDRPELDYASDGPFWTTELIDFDQNGTYSLIAGGNETSGHRSIIIPYDSASKSYAAKPITYLPTDSTYITPYDFIFDSTSKAIYVNRVNDLSTWGTNFPANVGNAIQKIDYTTLAASMLFTHSGYYNQSQGLTWIDWLGFYGNNVVAVNSGFGISVSK
ncbi:FG-GAP repeat domain-containing protein [Ralstonia mannitolilytica]|uniref:FG-GAP repeat domain-containing protein n=1 Tax=Ralstonia mannitolilytica TaxID=105219 RepID=UPI001425850D|nr:VCBS repeat-containing protein [Ralstonia mannitolilytica]